MTATVDGSSLGQAPAPLFERLRGAERILVAGCGGGFDVYAGLPLFLALRERKHEVFLGNLSFANPHVQGIEALTPELTRVDETAVPVSSYFPEHHLASWLSGRGLPSSVYCFDRTGVVRLRAAYERLIDELALDALVLVDGGTDCLMRGDEAGLGTPHEDILSLLAVDGLPIDRYLTCLGFGIDAYHGVCHAHFLENVAALAREGAFLGTFSVLPQQQEGADYLDAVRFATERDPQHASIVNSSIASAVEGCYGDHHRTSRTRGSRLWINPLMSIYWSFEMQPVIDRVLYADMLRDTDSFQDVVRIIESVRPQIEGRRPRRDIPV